MFVKFYWGLWAALAVATMALFLTANLTWLSITLVGFAACLFVFMGMMCLTPTVVGPHADEFHHADAEPVRTEKKAPAKAAKEYAPAGFGVRDHHA